MYIIGWCTFKPNTYRLVHAWIESDTASWFTPVRIFLILPFDGRFGANFRDSRCCVGSWTRLSNLGVRLGSTLLLRSLWSNVHVLGVPLFGFRQCLPTLSITFQLSLYKVKRSKVVRSRVALRSKWCCTCTLLTLKSASRDSASSFPLFFFESRCLLPFALLFPFDCWSFSSSRS